MVYRGRPSLGCAVCRQRKIKCDLGTPECGRCLKTGWKCPGYRKVENFRLVDESASLYGKYRRNKGTSDDSGPSSRIQVLDDSDSDKQEQSTRESGYASSSSLSFLDNDGLDLFNDSEKGFLVFQITPPLEDLARGFFETQFVSSGYMLIVENLRNDHTLGPLIQETMLSVGTMGISQWHRDTEVMRKAQQKYGKALVLTNESLRDPHKARLDETLVSVLVLSIFESLTGSSLMSVVRWQNHLKGLLALVSLRGNQQFKSPSGRVIFQHVRRLILFLCLWNESPAPAYFLNWIQLNKQGLDLFNLQAILVDEIGFRVAAWRASIKSGILTDEEEIVKVGLSLEAELITCATSLPTLHDEYDYVCVIDPAADPKEVWDGRYLVYNSFPGASTWSIIRAMRISVNRKLNLHMKRAGKEPEAPERVRTTAIVFDMIDEICHGVPWRLGSKAVRHPKRDSTLASVSGGFTTMFELLVAGETLCEEPAAPSGRQEGTCESDEQGGPSSATRRSAQLQWIIGRLNYMYKDLGIGQAGFFAGMLQVKWDAQVKLERAIRFRSQPELAEAEEAPQPYPSKPPVIELSSFERAAITAQVLENYRRLAADVQ